MPEREGGRVPERDRGCLRGMEGAGKMENAVEGWRVPEDRGFQKTEGVEDEGCQRRNEGASQSFICFGDEAY